MLNRGKFKSLIMVNWNGFFARKFELDKLVTTLSGGNGAGKSTTMASFITALIPDLSLLHFRNTTEAGSTSSSRDRGLYGKLKSGVCYAALECENSRGETFVFGARLQQILGRDKKVDIKLFSLSGLTAEDEALSLLLEFAEGKAKPLSLTELKRRFDKHGRIQFKQYSKIGDYHAMMFDQGILPKRLRTPTDRSRFYRLIEASLYGGISSTITKSLREYLLPENKSVQKAFQDMESAIIENRMTLNKIEQTSADRNFFQSLVEAATNYVGSDYIFQRNSRKDLIHTALKSRSNIRRTNQRLAELEQFAAEFSTKEANYERNYADLQDQARKANEYYNLMLNASRLQDQYQRQLTEVQVLEEEADLAKLQAEEVAFSRQELIETNQAQESELEKLRRQLSDTQAALDETETRKVQYKQAVAKLQEFNQQLAANATELSTLSHKLTTAELGGKLEIDAVAPVVQKLEASQEQVSSEFLQLKSQLQLQQSGVAEYQRTYQALVELSDGKQIPKDKAYSLAAAIVSGVGAKRELASRVASLTVDFNRESARRDIYQKSANQITQLQQQLGTQFSSRDELAEYASIHQEKYNSISLERDGVKDQLATLNLEFQKVIDELGRVNGMRMPYFKGQEELEKLEKKLQQPVNSQQELNELYGQYLRLKSEQEVEFQRLETKRAELEVQMAQLNQMAMGVETELQYLAQEFGGVLLSEIYDDVSIDDARYYAALYGPARDAIVVPSLEAIQEQLQTLVDREDIPSDLYFIEADFKNFQEELFDAENLNDKAVVVRINQQQLRFSTIGEATTFGKAAREKFASEVEAELKEVVYQRHQLEEKLLVNRQIAEQIQYLISNFLEVIFLPNPEVRAQEVNQQATILERKVNKLTEDLQNYNHQLAELNRQGGLLNKLMSIFQDEDQLNVEASFTRLQNELIQAQAASRYLEQFAKPLAQLEANFQVLQYQDDQAEDLPARFAKVQNSLNLLNKLVHLGAELVARKEYFSYQDLGELVGDELGNKLRAQLDKLEADYKQNRQQLTELNAQYDKLRNADFEKAALLKAAKKHLDELSQSLQQTGSSISDQALEQAKQQVENLQAEAQQIHADLINARNEFSRQQQELQTTKAQLSELQRSYRLQRQTISDSKQKWKESQQLAQEHGVSKRLLSPTLSAMSNDELRSHSDRALGLLRTLIKDNEYLRDSLKQSEDNRRPIKKVQFFIDVYNHLKDRIRQDILSTDDPMEAIERMELELAKLKNQLQEREKSLVISTADVASILDKTIQREQNRIWQLNQGLQNMQFGQVKSVRLNATYRESHKALLQALAAGHDQHADLFDNSELSFTEALAKLYQRTNLDVDFGQRNYQTVGEELLDYRNYIDLGIEVFRGSDGWLKAESGALSTGEAIGTGMSILLMVIQSWEAESKHLRARDLLPCRLLFLDEAARLDAKSIETLFELCVHQEMQLVIAAPENISPKNGTTYKLVRHVQGNSEFVSVVGLKGFGNGVGNAEATEAQAE